ncbi:hypothetical protein BJY04DRAFT_213474 [Aspergillus karnatakaensis]|uniref:uncharacterized protein n=1 Tax=Aspergillus karnatakaensis TaxID=1810916 RepID=UPI003CCCAE29
MSALCTAAANPKLATQINQLNIILSVVSLAQKPLSVLQLELILELLLKEEVLNLEEDFRTVYASLFLLRPDTSEDQNLYGNTDIVALRHSSFYEFFRTAKQAGPVGVDVDQAQTRFVYVLLSALAKRRTPCTNKYLGPLALYAQSFFSTHFERARPIRAGKLHEHISTLLHELFSNRECKGWFLENRYWGYVGDYCLYPSARFTEVVGFWLVSEDLETINERADMTLQWLFPETRRGFEDNSRESAVASNACSFTVLFSYIIGYLHQEWLEPPEIRPSDGLPAAAAALSMFYHDITAACTGEREDSGIVGIKALKHGTAEILAAAELHGPERTPLWHARVGQTLLSINWIRESLQHFELALNENHRIPILHAPSLSVIHRDMSRAYGAIGRHVEALEHYELSKLIVKDTEHVKYGVESQAGQLLNLARLKHRAKRTSDAAATANEAWELAIRAEEDDAYWYPNFRLFFNIFLELRQEQHLRSAFDRAFEFYNSPRHHRIHGSDFARFILGNMSVTPRRIYRLLQLVLSPDDHAHLQWLSTSLQTVDTWLWDQRRIPIVRCLLATLLFSKGRENLGVDQWSLVASLTEGDNDIHNIYGLFRYPRALSTGHLVTSTRQTMPV